MRARQEAAFLAFWKRWEPHPQCRFAFTHCGWYLDMNMPASLRAMTAGNPEVALRSQPVSPQLAGMWKKALAKRQLEFVLYPYAACVVGAMDGEALLRSLRYSREAAERTLGVRSCGLIIHDAPYGLNWGTEQLPQIARLIDVPFLVSGRCATVEALDGSSMPCVGSDRSLVGTIRDLAAGPAKVRPQVLEMHDHLHFLGGMLEGTHPLLKQHPLQLRSYSLSSGLPQRSRPRLPATDLGNKGWFGGLMDAIAIEQHVFQTQQMLLALEILQATGGGDTLAGDSQLRLWWKQSLVLADNHILWRAHDYRAHYLPCAEKLQRQVRAVLPRSSRVIFNPLCWERSGVCWPEEGDRSARPRWVERVGGWARAASVPLPAPASRRLSRRAALPGPAGCRVDRDGDLWFGATQAGLRILDRRGAKQPFTLPDGERSAAYTGTIALEWDWDLSQQPQATYLYRIECDEIRGDAYLLECEYYDVSGRMRDRTLHQLRAWSWEGGGLPRHVSHPDPAVLDLRFFTRAVLRIYVACEGEIGIRNLRAVPLRGSLPTPVRPAALRAVPQASCTYRPLQLDPGSMTRWGKEAAEARWDISEADCAGRISVRADKSSGLVLVSAVFDFADPDPLAWPTAPLGPHEGSLLGAGCERPYMPGLLFEMAAGRNARFLADRPFYVGDVLRASPETWHTDRRDWWMGFSPFSAAQFAASRAEGGATALLATRGLHHFFRRRDRNNEWLGVSLGCGLPHPEMQGFTVPRESPVHPLVGRVGPGYPIADAVRLQACGRYRCDFAVGWRPNRWPTPSLWKTAREFASPLLPVPADFPPATILEGIDISPASVVATACERVPEGLRLRLLNLGDRKLVAKIRVKPGRKPVALPMPPYALRECTLK